MTAGPLRRGGAWPTLKGARTPTVRDLFGEYHMWLCISIFWKYHNKVSGREKETAAYIQQVKTNHLGVRAGSKLCTTWLLISRPSCSDNWHSCLWIALGLRAKTWTFWVSSYSYAVILHWIATPSSEAHKGTFQFWALMMMLRLCDNFEIKGTW